MLWHSLPNANRDPATDRRPKQLALVLELEGLSVENRRTKRLANGDILAG
jgi:hypothetical protein